MRPITAADLMNPEVLTVPDDMTVGELATFLVANEIAGAPVTDAAGRIVGVVSVFDIARLLGEEDDDDDLEEPDDEAPGSAPEAGEAEVDGVEDLLVEDVMTPQAFSVSEDATVQEVAALMLKEHLHRLLVVREDEPVGIISTSDLLGLLVDEA
jgi:CBS domain-containing protein